MYPITLLYLTDPTGWVELQPEQRQRGAMRRKPTRKPSTYG